MSDRGGDLVQVDAVLGALPGTQASYDAVSALRAAVHAVPGADALVGGSVADTLDGGSGADEIVGGHLRAVGPHPLEAQERSSGTAAKLPAKG